MLDISPDTARRTIARLAKVKLAQQEAAAEGLTVADRTEAHHRVMRRCLARGIPAAAAHMAYIDAAAGMPHDSTLAHYWAKFMIEELTA